jgi:hypothetical protein
MQTIMRLPVNNGLGLTYTGAASGSLLPCERTFLRLPGYGRPVPGVFFRTVVPVAVLCAIRDPFFLQTFRPAVLPGF